MPLLPLGFISFITGGLFTDLFNRVTSGSLGSPWNAIRGVWFANGSAAQSNDAASAYPIAVVPVATTDISSAVGVGGGTGLSFWVSDANNWWSTTYNNNSSSYSCNCQTCYQTICNTCTVTSCPSCGSYYSCSSGFVCQTTKCCVGVNTVIGNATLVCNSCTVTSCPSCGSYQQPFSCNCQTCTDIFHYLRLSRSVSGTITTSVVSDVVLSQAAAALKLSITGNAITATAFSDANKTNLIGTLSTTQAGATKAATAGIIKTPSSYTQSSTVDDFSAEGK